MIGSNRPELEKLFQAYGWVSRWGRPFYGRGAGPTGP
jgi:hypothetical protein